VTWQLLRPHIPSLISHVIFPLICLTQDDLDLWEDNPVVYIHKNIDVYEEYLSPDVASNGFLLTLATKRQKSSFNGILQFINTTLSQLSPDCKANIVLTVRNIPNERKLLSV
jgi:importin-7